MWGKNLSGQALPLMPACGAGTHPQNSTTVCALILSQSSWGLPPKHPALLPSDLCPSKGGCRQGAFQAQCQTPTSLTLCWLKCWLKAAVAGSPLLLSNCHRWQFYLLQFNSWLIIISCFSSCLTCKKMHRNVIISFLLFVLPAPYTLLNILAKPHHSEEPSGHFGAIHGIYCSYPALPHLSSGFVQDPFFLQHTTYRLHMFWEKKQLIIWFCDALK